MSASSRLPVSIDPWRLATKRAQLSGYVPILAFGRLSELLEGHKDQVQVELEFEPGKRGQALVTGQASVDVEFTCQRCLGSVWLLLQSNIRLGVVQTERESEGLPGGYEPLIREEDNCRIELLVEDDLILALPQVARHAEGECSFPAQLADVVEHKENTEKENPFDVLKDFKKD